MIRNLRFTAVFLLSFFILNCQSDQADDNFDPNLDQILVFTKTAGFRHASIDRGVSALQALASENQFQITRSEDSGIFSESGLARFDLVIFLNTTGNILNDSQQEAFVDFINAGGSFMGVHAATDTEFNWPWYGKLVGAYFESHPSNPNVRQARLDVLNNNHPSTTHLQQSWERSDEWYNFRDINPDIQVLINIDESSYEGGTNGDFHPMAWYHLYEGGRVFYTAGGHTEASYDEPDFRRHLLGGIFYCLNRN